jgi:hypothetical protein
MDPIAVLLGAFLSPTAVIILLVLVLAFLLYMWFTTPALPGSTAPGNAAAIGAGTSGFQSGPIEGFEQAVLSDENRTLQNLQPLTIKQAGYLGGNQMDGIEGIKNAFIAGARSMVLQIDFVDAPISGGNYAEPGVPTLLYRDDNGLLLSKNGADLETTIKSLATYAFKPEVPNSDKPVILYLHLRRAPNAVTKPQDYLKYLSQIAKNLAPLAPNHLGMTPLGTFNRQKNESLLFRTPISQLGGKFIVLCNADTSMFQQSAALGYGTYEPKEDLDFWVNARVYLQNAGDFIGITEAAGGSVKPNATVVKLSDAVAGGSTFGKATVGTFTIAMPSMTANPTPEDLKTALDVAGVSVVPLDLFSETLDKIKPLTTQYAKKSFRAKPAALCTLLMS